MAFKLTVLGLILIAVAVCAWRGYRNALRQYAKRQAVSPPQGEGVG
ncbi:hypothetical protein [Pseudothauera hydrothermalis]|nr:hypothetical protein [Pseudothauera hydrothermalis]